MKVAIIGGAGRVGRRIAERLALWGANEITLADRVAPSDRLGLAFSKVDIEDTEGLRSLAECHDVIVNTVGPFDQWGATVLEAAISARSDYVDVCDDPLPTLELLTRSDRAAAAGVRAVVGLGASPGLPNLLMLCCCARLRRGRDTVLVLGRPI